MTARRRGCGIRVTDSRADARRGDFPSPNGQGDLSRIPQGRQATKPPKGAKQTKQAKAQDPDEISFVGVLFAAVGRTVAAVFRRRCQPVTTVTSPIPRAFTGSAIRAASPTRTVTSRSTGKALTTAAVASTVPVSASRA